MTSKLSFSLKAKQEHNTYIYAIKNKHKSKVIINNKFNKELIINVKYCKTKYYSLSVSLKKHRPIPHVYLQSS